MPKIEHLTNTVVARRNGASAESSPDTFIGRERELAVLYDLLERPGQEMRSAFVEGEAGMGKTSLVDEFIRRASENGMRVLRGHCYQVDGAGPYFPFIQILDQLRIAGSSSDELLERLADDALGKTNWDDLSADVWGRKARFLRTLSKAIQEAAASEATILCIEDAHWADVGSLLLLNNLLDLSRGGLFIVCTARTDEPMEAETRQLLGRVEQKSRRIALSGFADAEVATFVDNLVGVGAVTEVKRQALRAFTSGNPLLLREVLLHLKESDLLEMHTVQEAILQSRTPDRLAHVIDLRLRGLSDIAYQVASACSAFGAEFTAPLIALVRSEPNATTEESLQLCVSRGVLRRVPNMGAPTYRFTHPLFLMRLYEMLRPTARRDLHRKIAEVAATGELQLSVDELARHYALGFGAQGGREAVNYCRAAAKHAERLLAFESAARFWELALRCTKSRSKRQRAILKRHLGWALWAAGKWNQASEVWSEAVLLFEALEDRRQIGKLALALGDMHRWRAELDRSEHWLKRALDTPFDRSNDRARALALLGSIHCLRNGRRQGLALLEEASGLVGSNGGDPLVAYWLSYGFMATGDRERAYAIAKTGFSDARRRGASRAVALLGGNLVLHELCRLQPTAARSYSRAVKGALDPTDTTSQIRSPISEAWIFAYSGDWKRAERLCQDWMAQIRLSGRFQAATARVFWSEARFASGDAHAAQVEIERALPDLDEMRPVASLHLARALVRLGEKEAAAALVRQHAHALSASSRSMAAAGRVMLGEVASRLDDPDLWRDCYELLQREASPIVIAYSPISVKRVLGRLASRLKLWPKAIEHFDSAVEELTQGDAHWELAQTYLAYAEMRRERRRRGDDRKGSTMQMEARAILSRLGMEHVETGADERAAGNRFGLTGRELEILALVAEGRRNHEIAEALTVSYRTVTGHLESILAKMDAASRTEAVIQGVQEGLVGPLTRSQALR